MEYVLMDLERTLVNSVPAFWKQNRHGYTYKIEYAGLFPEEVALAIVTRDHDKKTIAIPYKLIEKILAKDLKQHESF